VAGTPHADAGERAGGNRERNPDRGRIEAHADAGARGGPGDETRRHDEEDPEWRPRDRAHDAMLRWKAGFMLRACAGGPAR
jgi:hypothetical protein